MSKSISVLCPYCHTRTNTSCRKACSPLLTTFYAQCTNVQCGARFHVNLEISYQLGSNSRLRAPEIAQQLELLPQ